jgi:hypothetical protein
MTTPTNVLVRGLDGRTRCVRVSLDRRVDATAAGKAGRAGFESVVRDAIRAANPNLCPPGCVVRASRTPFGDDGGEDVWVSVTARLVGGKGGFGTQLRTSARRGAQTTNFDACRDLQGRRLRAVNGEKKIAQWEAENDEREAEKKAMKYIKEEAGTSERARLKALEEKEREAYNAESAKVSESVDNAVSAGLKEAAAIEAERKRRMAKGKESVSEIAASDDDDDESDDDDLDDSALLFPRAAKKAKTDVGASTSSPTDDPSKSASPTSAPAAKEPVEEAKDVSAQKDDPSAVNLSDYASAEALEALGLDALKAELVARRLKCGGTIKERAARLFLLRDKTREEIDRKHWAK